MEKIGDRSFKIRDTNIDILRGIGMLLIILAHVEFNFYVHTIRCFDVPLMVFVSGLSYANRKAQYDFSSFCKRGFRLLFPLYIFLIFYLVIYFTLRKVNVDLGPTKQEVFDTFLLKKGFGYIWIIRTFLIIAIISPFLISISNKIKSFSKLTLYLFFYLSLFIILSTIKNINNIQVIEKIYTNFIIVPFGYSVLFILGLQMSKINNKDILKLIAGFTLIFIFYTLYLGYTTNIYFDINYYKYPLKPYFIIYGALCSLILYFYKQSIVRFISFNKNLEKTFLYISVNSIWIYLWHIVFIQLSVGINPFFRYFIVLFFSILVVVVQKWLVSRIITSYPKSADYLKYMMN